MFIPYLRKTFLSRFFSIIKACIHWHNRNYSSPSPHFIKQACLLRNSHPNSTWVETGTYLGETTKLLSKYSPKVYSLEPEPTLFKNASIYFSRFKNVQILNGTSEEIFPMLLPKIIGDVNFWLDGHYSGEGTFQGSYDTPILDELKFISDNLSHFGKVCVFVDDIRCFGSFGSFGSSSIEYIAYPSLDELVDWARKNNLKWHIEHDIFFAKN